LNIIRSEFRLTKATFKDAPSDALDVDFSSGSILNSSFNNIEGDGVDFSGSRVDLEGFHIRNVNDKGVSVGESTYVSGRDTRFSTMRAWVSIP